MKKVHVSFASFVLFVFLIFLHFFMSPPSKGGGQGSSRWGCTARHSTARHGTARHGTPSAFFLSPLTLRRVGESRGQEGIALHGRVSTPRASPFSSLVPYLSTLADGKGTAPCDVRCVSLNLWATPLGLGICTMTVKSKIL